VSRGEIARKGRGTGSQEVRIQERQEGGASDASEQARQARQERQERQAEARDKPRQCTQ
jgi:hypothetical protein